MPYKRPIQNIKKYIPKFYSPLTPYLTNSAGSFVHNDSEFFGIPLPNEKEISPNDESENRKGLSFSSVIKYIQSHVKIEELILIGLIVLMLDESFEDDLLLIILFYILLF